MQTEKMKIECHKFPSSCKGGFPPGASQLYGLGFDTLSISKSAILVRKNQSESITGEPYLFFGLEARKNEVILSYSVPDGSDKGIRKLHAALFMARILSLLPQIQPDSAAMSGFLLPALESASKISGTNFEQVAKKLSDAQQSCNTLLAKNGKLSRLSEKNTLSLLELERQNFALASRVSKLESVSDAALREFIIEWVSSHRGEFNAVQFSKAYNIPHPRAEEGLDSLLKSGAVSRLSGQFGIQRHESHGTFAIKKHNPFSALLGKHAH